MPRDYTTTVLVPAAGNGSRFNVEGYTGLKPFYRFEILGHPLFGEHFMFEYALNGTEDMNRVVGFPKLIAEKQVEELHSKTPQNIVFHTIVETSGQADTVLQLLRLAQPKGPVLIINSDMGMRSQHAIKKFVDDVTIKTDAEAAVMVRQSTDAASYSFVSSIGPFTHAAEKKRISDWAIVGVFWFRSAHSLEVALMRMMQEYPHQEPYLSGVFEYYPEGTCVARGVHPGAVLEFDTSEKIREARALCSS